MEQHISCHISEKIENVLGNYGNSCNFRNFRKFPRETSTLGRPWTFRKVLKTSDNFGKLRESFKKFRKVQEFSGETGERSTISVNFRRD